MHSQKVICGDIVNLVKLEKHFESSDFRKADYFPTYVVVVRSSCCCNARLHNTMGSVMIKGQSHFGIRNITKM